jgi:hypothetical protein
MKIGIISPIKFLDKYCITDVQYCLPRLLVDYESYWKFYKGRKKEGDTTILDCRKPSWRREPESFRTIELALGMLKPDIIIAPSYMFNKDASKEIHKKFVEEFVGFKNIIVKCLEGSSEQDIEVPPRSKSVAIPSHMFRYLNSIKLPTNTIFIENHINLEELGKRKGILVTSLPVKLGLLGRLMSDYRPSPNSLTFEEKEDDYPKITLKNIKDTIEFYKE